MQATKNTQRVARLPQWRIQVLLMVMMLGAGILIARLFYLQVIQNEFLGGKAADAHKMVRETLPARGTIKDRNGVILAANETADRLYAEPRNIEDPAAVAAKVAPIIGQPVAEVQRRLSGDGYWVSLATRLTPEQSQAIRDLKIPGIGLEPEPVRAHPNGTLASHVLGFTNFENVGSYGVEGMYNEYLAGEPGQVSGEHDSIGNWLAIGSQEIVPPKDGADLQLTLDTTIQHFAEEELEKAVREQRAKGGSIIVMNPKTGEVLAMASSPDFDPDKFYQISDTSRFVNPAISRMYEPGSTFKILTMAAGLQEGVITPDTRFNDPGYLTVYGYTVHNWDGRAHPNESMTEVLMNSANVGAAYVSTKLGKDAFYRYMLDFGLSQQTGIDLQGEEEGMLILPSSKHWSPINLYTNAYGQGIAVTPIQLITAEAAVANGGLLMRPYVVSKVTRDGKVIKENKPAVVRRVLSKETAETLKGMMQTVVDEGEYQVARIPGYSIGGKTGTAGVPTKNGYHPTLTIASFIGYSPVKDPKFIVLVKIDEPKKSPWGSEVAAPVFKNLARRIYAYMDIPPDRPVTDADANS